jgi:molecular chaperone HscA
MTDVLCLDFGTSSIRAVVRDAQSNRVVLPIGQVTQRQNIDGASIPSAFCIDADLETVRFGQPAQEAILGSKKLAYFVTSPKRWLTEPKLLGNRVLPELEITRRDVLTGLMGYALFAANSSGYWKAPNAPDEADIRVAHPVWPLSIKDDADRALGQIAWMALNMATEGDWGITTAEVLCSWTTPSDSTEVRPVLHIKIDTVEPIAAAVELLPNAGNERRICMVVDVGAGTTDIGVFQHLSPDSQANKGDRLIPAGPATSIFKAGDEIDRVVLCLLRASNPKTFDANEARIKSEIRFQKESLFKNGRIQVAGIDFSLAALEQSDEINTMAASIRQGVENCLSNAYSKINIFTSTAGLASEIIVVMAGGGAEIQFLRQAVGKPLTVNGSKFTFKFIKPNPPKLNMHGAGYERLAVGLGGAQEGFEKVVHKHAKLLRISGLGPPKQTVSS